MDRSRGRPPGHGKGASSGKRNIRKSRGRPPGHGKGASSGKRNIRKQEIAAAVIEGKPVAAIARAHGISRSWASKEANAPATRVLIADLVDQHRGKVEALVALSLQRIEEGLGATELQIKKTKKGVEIKERPDHRVRLLAAKRLIEITRAGRTEESESKSVTCTWQQFVNIYHQQKGKA